MTVVAADRIRYQITHRTAYAYGSMVTVGHNRAHLLPREVPHQTVHHAQLTVEPAAEHQAEQRDMFGNRVVYLAVQHPHDHLAVTATSEVSIEPPEPWTPGSLDAPPWDRVPALLARNTTFDGILARQFALDSPLVSTSDELADYARPSFPAGRPLDEAVADLSARIHAEFLFDPHFSTVSTPLGEVLAHRRGVCQDFAHLAIGCLRSLGLPARYVSGYLETLPPPGQPKLVGADASHAWLSVYVPGSGWFDLDPTNDQVPPQRHITVAWGRDYADVTPLRGVVFGSETEQSLDVSVDVIRV